VDARVPSGRVPRDLQGSRRCDRSSRVRDATSILVVDGNNVIGSVANGWWRDRPAAARRLLARLQCFNERATLVLDVAQPDLPEGDHHGVAVRYARRRGRDAADDLIRELLVEVPDARVVTSDRALRRDVEAAGATVIGSGAFLAILDSAGC
jgi:8-oxo-dGTP diphosphatase